MRTGAIVPPPSGHNLAMTEDELENVDDEEREEPDEGGNPWAKTSSGDADEITDDD
jgi:hypothetical protein